MTRLCASAVMYKVISNARATRLSICFAERLITAETQATMVGFSLLTALAVLAAIEHWLMVVPLPDAKLWRWMLPDTATSRQDHKHEL